MTYDNYSPAHSPAAYPPFQARFPARPCRWPDTDVSEFKYRTSDNEKKGKNI